MEKWKNRKFCWAHDLSESPKPRRISGELSLSTPIKYGKNGSKGAVEASRIPYVQIYVCIRKFFHLFHGPFSLLFPHAATRGSYAVGQ